MMGRIRTIKPEFFTHEGLFDAEEEEGLPLRIAFAGLWTQCDREGRFKWEPRRLKLACLPYDNVDFSRVLDALATRGFVKKYASNTGELFGFVPSWRKNQVINNKESPSTLPNPEDCCLEPLLTREPRVNHALATPLSKDQGERKGKERKGKEGERKERELVACPETEKNAFEKFWQAWPTSTRKSAKSKCMNLWQRMKLDDMADEIIEHVKFLSRSNDWKKSGGEYIPAPLTYLNQKRWEGAELVERIGEACGTSKSDLIAEHNKQVLVEIFGGKECDSRGDFFNSDLDGMENEQNAPY